MRTKADVNQSPFVVVQDQTTQKIKRVAIPSDTQIGMRDAPSELMLLGRLALSSKQYALNSVTGGSTHLTNDDTIVGIVNTLGSPLTGTVYLPGSPRTGQFHVIKDEAGTASACNLVVSGSSGARIDGALGYTVSASFGKVCVYWRDAAWFVMFP